MSSSEGAVKCGRKSGNERLLTNDEARGGETQSCRARLTVPQREKEKCNGGLNDSDCEELVNVE